MFRTDQAIFLLETFFRQLLGWLLGNGAIACCEPAQAASSESGSLLSRCVEPQDQHNRTNIKRMVVQLDSVPFHGVEPLSVPQCGGVAPASRPSPPGRV